MKEYKVTYRQSFLGKIYSAVLKLFTVKKKLAKASYEQLHSLEDTKTPVKKGYEKEIIEEAVCWWIHKEKSVNGILVYIPGGGFIMGPLQFHWKYCGQMSERLNMAVFVIRYRLAPEFPFPAGLNDIVKAITTLQAKDTLQKKWYLAGDSAGGNLAIAACYKLNDIKAVLPAKVILAFPSLDMTANENDPEKAALNKKDKILSTEFVEKAKQVYAKVNEVSDPLLSPVNGNLAILPPVLLQHGDDDMLVAGSRKFAEKMHAAGKTIWYEEYEGMHHGFIFYPGLPEAKKAIRSQIQFIKE